MSSDSSDYGTSSAKVYKLKSRKTFPAWKQKTLSLAKSKGYERFLLNNVPVKTEVELEAEEAIYIGLTDAGAKALKKREIKKWKKERDLSTTAAAVLTMSVKSKDLKILNKCKGNPKAMMDALINKYGSEEDSDF